MDLPKARRVWGGLAGLAGIVILLLILGRIFDPSPSLDRGRRAFEQGDWAAAIANANGVLAANSRDEQAIRLKARGMVHQGQLTEALKLDAGLGGERLEAEDLALIGLALVANHRDALGWAALDAAAKLEPTHPAATAALAGRPRVGVGSAGNNDKLAAIPDGRALAELAVGLAALAQPSSSSADADRLLDSALRRDRATLLKVNTVAAARKLLARLLLEEGRAAEARDRLGSLVDPEAQWLLSRAYLVEGDSKRAVAAAERAGSFGADQLITTEPSRYVGAQQCAECHREIFDTQQSSHHSATVAWGQGLQATPLPRGPVVDPANPAVNHRFERDGQTLAVTAQVGNESFRAAIDYALGSGHHGVTMLAREPDGRHRSLRLSYYSGGDYWGLTSGFEPRPADPHAYIGEVLNEDSFRNCLNCHTTRFTAEADRRGPEVADHGIGCERCHGPGDHHIRAVESNFVQVAIGRPRQATPAARLKLCAQCHSSDGVIPPADPRFIRFQATTLPYSRCVSESGGRLDCVACHDPHRNVETNPAYYEERCLACHAGGGRPTSPGNRVEAVTASRCSVNATTGCVACHMPKVEKIMPFMSFTDHHIRVHPSPDQAGAARSQP